MSAMTNPANDELMAKIHVDIAQECRDLEDRIDARRHWLAELERNVAEGRVQIRLAETVQVRHEGSFARIIVQHVIAPPAAGAIVRTLGPGPGTER